MYTYSPIKNLYIKNFRNIKEAIINFEESPVVCLIGDNEAGKTSVIKAFSVCALHSTPREQKNYIRDNTEGFGVAIELQNGIKVVRMKTKTANIYNIQENDKIIWNATKIDSGLPAEVQKLMGLLEEPETKEYLQVRTYENQLLFVVTPTSTNYKVMYDALKIDQIAKAIKIGSTDANRLKNDIHDTDNGIDTLNKNLRQLRLHDISHLLSIKQRIRSELDDIEILKKSVSTHRKIEESVHTLGEYVKIGEAEEIVESEVVELLRAKKLWERVQEIKKEMESIKEIESLEAISIDDVNSMWNILDLKNKIDTNKLRFSTIISVNDVEEIDELEATSILTILSKEKEIRHLKNYCDAIDSTSADLIQQEEFNQIVSLYQMMGSRDKLIKLGSTIKEIDEYCSKLTAYLAYAGVEIEICPNCGEQIVIDVDKYRGENNGNS